MKIAVRLLPLFLIVTTLTIFGTSSVAKADPPSPPGPSVYNPGPPGLHIAPDRATLAKTVSSGSPGFASPSSTTNMTYHGGPVQHTTKVYTVFWDPAGTIPDYYIDLVNRYFQDIGTTAFYNINTQYYDNVPSANTPMQNVSTLGGTWHDSVNTYPQAGTAADPLLDSGIRAEVDRAIAHGFPTPGISGGDGVIIFVYTANGIESCTASDHKSCTPGVADPVTCGPSSNASCGRYCAYHWDNSGKLYANMPYVETWTTNCRGVSVSPNGHMDADAEISTSSHEHFEAATDPYGDAWYDTDNTGENGDKCAYVYQFGDKSGYANGTIQADGHNLVLNGHPYITQLEWSNADLDPTKAFSGCVSRFAANVDVSITKTDSPDPVISGSNLSYSIGVTNTDSTFEATDLVMTDTIPANTTFQSLTAPAGWSCATPAINGTGQVQCTILSLAKAATDAFTLVVNVSSTASGPISNTATVASSSGDPTSSNNSASTTTAVTSQADLSITKSDSPDPVIAGDQLTYTIVVHNSGPASASGVSVTDVLPSGVSYISDSAGCTGGGSTKTCSLGTIASGANSSITIQVLIPANFLSGSNLSTTTVTNDASVTSTSFDPNTGNNSTSIDTTVVESADLAVNKDCKPDPNTPVAAGTDAFCNIYVDNLGPSDAQHVSLTDVIITHTSFRVTGVTLDPPSSGTCAPLTTGNVSSTTISCDLGIEPAGARTTVTVHFTSDTAADVDDTATVTSSTPDPVGSNNTAVNHVHFFSSANLAISKSAVGSTATTLGGPVAPPVGGAFAGTTLTYTINVTNNGPSAAANVVVTDNLPVQVTNVSYVSAGNTCDIGVPGSLPLVCNMGTIASGATESITVTATVKANTPNGTILFNNASVAADTADPNNSDNAASVSTTVTTLADLSITKVSDAAQYKPNTTVTYHITVTNNGPSDAQNVKVIDTLPDQKQAIYLSDTAGCIFQAPKTLTCNLGTLAAGQSVDFFVKVTVKGAQGDVVNTATVSSTTNDPYSANNTAIKTVVVKGGK